MFSLLDYGNVIHTKLFGDCGRINSIENVKCIYTPSGAITFHMLNEIIFPSLQFVYFYSVDSRTLIEINGGDIGVSYIHVSSLFGDNSNQLAAIQAFIEGSKSRASGNVKLIVCIVNDNFRILDKDTINERVVGLISDAKSFSFNIR